MTSVDYLILGAGPAGLTVANKLLDAGIDSFLVLEKEEEAGGLCRSMEVDGSPLDIGGGHILDVRRPKVTEYLFRFLPEEEWAHFVRNSKIHTISGVEIDYPYEANIWQFPVEEQVEHLMAIARTGSSIGQEMPTQFDEWIVWKLGEKIAKDYMFPYNHKIWSIDLKRLGTYWLEKLPNVSLKDTLTSCLTHEPQGSLPGHAQFYYPKEYGFGEVWLRMAERVKEHIRYGEPAVTIDMVNKVVNGAYQGNVIINTVPWTSFETIEGVTDEISTCLNKLEHSAVVIEYQDKEVKTDAHWTYYPDEALDYHRILWRKNFCGNSKGYWTETNLKRYQKDDSKFYYINEYAYPLNTVDKPEAIAEIKDWAEKYDVIGLGRWGEWEHLNTDVTVEHAFRLVDRLLERK